MSDEPCKFFTYTGLMEHRQTFSALEKNAECENIHSWISLCE